MTQLLSFPPGCILRPATPEDLGSIRMMVFKAKLDPTQLRWQQFWMIEQNGQIIACGQLRNFSDVQELGSLVVDSNWRGQGFGSKLAQHLIQQATQPLYLECLGQYLPRFYEPLGFVPISWQELPPALRRKFGFSQLGRVLLKLPITFMRYRDKQVFEVERG